MEASMGSSADVSQWRPRKRSTAEVASSSTNCTYCYPTFVLIGDTMTKLIIGSYGYRTLTLKVLEHIYV